MEAIVARTFRDKHTMQKHVVGHTYESDNLERIKELQKAGFLKGTSLALNNDIPLKSSVPKETSIVADHNAYQLMTKSEIRQILENRKVKYNMRQSKEQLLALLIGGGE